MQFTSFPRSLFALTILLSSAPLPTIAIPTGHPSAPATVDDTASANFVSVNDPAAILALLQAADVKYNRASRSGLNGDESEKVYVSHRVVIDEDYLERSNAPDHVKQQYRNDMSSSGTESLQRRQWGNTYIQCETTGGSPEALHVHVSVFMSPTK